MKAFTRACVLRDGVKRASLNDLKVLKFIPTSSTSCRHPMLRISLISSISVAYGSFHTCASFDSAVWFVFLSKAAPFFTMFIYTIITGTFFHTTSSSTHHFPFIYSFLAPLCVTLTQPPFRKTSPLLA